MKKLNAFILILMLCYNTPALYSQNTDFDTKYSAEYVLKDAAGIQLISMKHYRDGDKLKFIKTDNKGKDNETTTEIYIFKNESKVYTVISGRNYKSGSRHALDMSFIGMQTGVYILDLGNDGTLFNSAARNGTGRVLGKDCVKYTLTSFGDASSDYYMYQDNLMLKRWVGSPTEGNSIEVITYDPNAEIPAGTFTLPTGVDFPDF